MPKAAQRHTPKRALVFRQSFGPFPRGLYPKVCLTRSLRRPLPISVEELWRGERRKGSDDDRSAPLTSSRSRAQRLRCPPLWRSGLARAFAGALPDLTLACGRRPMPQAIPFIDDYSAIAAAMRQQASPAVEADDAQATRN